MKPFPFHYIENTEFHLHDLAIDYHYQIHIPFDE